VESRFKARSERRTAWSGFRLQGAPNVYLRGAALLALVFAAAGGTAQARSHSHGYLFVAPGTFSFGDSDAALAAGVGGEGVFPGGVVGLGAELAAVGVRGSSDTTFGLASVNGYFHVPRPYSNKDLFLTAGYSALFQFSEKIDMFNVGGGINWWLAPHVGLKAEFRNHARTGDDTVNFATFRAGIAFH